MEYIKYQWAKVRRWWILFHLEGSVRYKIRVLTEMLNQLEEATDDCGLCILAFKTIDFRGYYYRGEHVRIPSRRILEILGITHFEPPDHIKYDQRYGSWWFSHTNKHVRRIILWEMLRYYRELNFSAEVYSQYKSVVPVDPLPADPMGWLIQHDPSFKHWCIYHF